MKTKLKGLGPDDKGKGTDAWDATQWHVVVKWGYPVQISQRNIMVTPTLYYEDSSRQIRHLKNH